MFFEYSPASCLTIFLNATLYKSLVFQSLRIQILRFPWKLSLVTALMRHKYWFISSWSKVSELVVASLATGKLISMCHFLVDAIVRGMKIHFHDCNHSGICLRFKTPHLDYWLVWDISRNPPGISLHFKVSHLDCWLIRARYGYTILPCFNELHALYPPPWWVVEEANDYYDSEGQEWLTMDR